MQSVVFYADLERLSTAEWMGNRNVKRKTILVIQFLTVIRDQRINCMIDTGN